MAVEVEDPRSRRYILLESTKDVDCKCWIIASNCLRMVSLFIVLPVCKKGQVVYFVVYLEVFIPSGSFDNI